MKHPCELCSHLNLKFNKKWKLRHHQRKQHGLNTPHRFTCTNCSYTTDNKVEWQQHTHKSETNTPPPTPIPSLTEITNNKAAFRAANTTTTHTTPTNTNRPSTILIDPIPIRTTHKTPVQSGRRKTATSQYQPALTRPTHQTKQQQLLRKQWRTHTTQAQQRPILLPSPNATTNYINLRCPLGPITQHTNSTSAPAHESHLLITLDVKLLTNPHTGEVTATLESTNIQQQ